MIEISKKETFEYDFDFTLFDIETTGLNRKFDYMYMFGILKKSGNITELTQYIINDKNDENELIKTVVNKLKDEIFTTFNGDRFDLPFIRQKEREYGLNHTSLSGFDIYKEFRNLNFFFREKSLKAIDLGKKIGLKVSDYVTSDQMPQVYKMYQELYDDVNLKKLAYHNYIDLKVLAELLNYKNKIIDPLLTVKNKYFSGIVRGIFFVKNFLVLKLEKKDEEKVYVNEGNFKVKSNKNVVFVRLETQVGRLSTGEVGYAFKQYLPQNLFKFSKGLKNNAVLLIKDKELIRENFLLLLNTLGKK